MSSPSRAADSWRSRESQPFAAIGLSISSLSFWVLFPFLWSILCWYLQGLSWSWVCWSTCLLFLWCRDHLWFSCVTCCSVHDLWWIHALPPYWSLPPHESSLHWPAVSLEYQWAQAARIRGMSGWWECTRTICSIGTADHRSPADQETAQYSWYSVGLRHWARWTSDRPHSWWDHYADRQANTWWHALCMLGLCLFYLSFLFYLFFVISPVFAHFVSFWLSFAIGWVLRVSLECFRCFCLAEAWEDRRLDCHQQEKAAEQEWRKLPAEGSWASSGCLNQQQEQQVAAEAGQRAALWELVLL